MVKDDSQFSTGHQGRVMPENKMQKRGGREAGLVGEVGWMHQAVPR